MAKLDLNDGQFRPSIDGIENGKTSQVTGMNRILNFIQGNINYLKSLVDSKANRTLNINAGKGLQGGGALSKDVTLNVVSVNDAIIVNDNNIQLNPVNDLTTGGADKALSGEMGKKLNTDKQNKTDSGLKTNKKNVIDAINSSLNMKERPASFDGTFIDFYNKFKIGSYAIPREVGYFDKFGFPDGTYNYGVLTVYETVEGALRIDFYTDEHREKLTTTIYQFGLVQTRPEWQSKTFKDNVKWNLQLTDKSKLFLGTSGISSVTYIQDSGTKTQGQGYIDKSTGQVYLCLETNTDTTITNKFMSITNVELGKKVESSFWKLNPKVITDTNFDILGVYEAGFYSALSDEAQKNWINKPYIGSLCYGLLYQNQLHNRRSVLYIDITGRIYSNTQTTSGTPMSWTGWKKEVIDADIVDNLTTADKSKVLSANMGKYLEDTKNITKTTLLEDGSTTLKGSLECNNQRLEVLAIRSDKGAHEGMFIMPKGAYNKGALTKLVFRRRNSSNKDELEFTDFDVFHQGNYEKNKIMLGNMGVNNLIYIQDAGEKTAGNGYVDKTTGQLYLCKTTNSDTSVTSNFVLATNIETAKRQHFTKTILFDKPTGHGNGNITLSDNWENYDEFIVYGSSDNVDYVGSHRFKKEDIEYSVSKGQRFIIYGEANDYWIVRITTGSKTWASGDKWENCAIFRIIGIKYGG